MSTMNRLSRVLIGVTLTVAASLTYAQQGGDGPSQLRAAFDEKRATLAEPVLHRPMLLESTETASQVQVEIVAPIDFGYASVRGGLSGADQWCQMLILHLNNKHCHATRSAATTNLFLQVASRYDQPAKDAFPLSFQYQVPNLGNDYLKVVMMAEKGPMGTHDYRIMLEATPMAAGRTLLRFSYSYEFGTMARLGMQAYSATTASSKVGFSPVPGPNGAPPKPVGGLRGIVERNAMRYFLAIEAYLDAMSTPAPEQYERRLTNWFALTERYPRQLHETDLDHYLSTKRSERDAALAGN